MPLGVAPGFLLGIYVFGEDDRGQPVVVAHESVLASVVRVVVVGATGGRVFDAGASAVDPSVDMAHFEVLGRHCATGDDAAAVAGQDRLAHVVGDKALFAADVQYLALTVEDDGNDPGVAEFPTKVPGGNRESVLGDARLFGHAEQCGELAIDNEAGPGQPGG